MSKKQAKSRRQRPGPESRDAAPTPRRRWRNWTMLLLAAPLLLLGGAAYAVFAFNQPPRNPPTLAVQIVNKYPHDPAAYTQGLVYDQGLLIEGTGRYGQSSLREVRLETGRIERQTPLPDNLFGEGVTLMGDRIYQLTWKEKVCVVYDRRTFTAIGKYRYAGEGWGLTHDGTHLIMSDGTPTLRFLDPETFRVVRRLDVRMGRRRIDEINELEYIDGSIYANVWYEDFILQISPRTGQVEALIDLRGLYPANQRPNRDEVLNGIAYDEKTGRLFVTGKNWPQVFEIRVRR